MCISKKKLETEFKPEPEKIWPFWHGPEDTCIAYKILHLYKDQKKLLSTHS